MICALVLCCAGIFAGFCSCFTAQDTTGGVKQDKTAAGAEVQREDTTGGAGQDKTAAGAEVQHKDTTGGGKKHNKEGEDTIKDQKDAS